MKDLLIVLLLVCTVAAGLYFLHRNQTPPPQDTHTGLLKGTVHDKGCDPTEMTLECNGAKPR